MGRELPGKYRYTILVANFLSYGCHGAEPDQCRCYLMFADANRCLLKLRGAVSNLYKDPGDLGPKCGRCQLRQP